MMPITDLLAELDQCETLDPPSDVRKLLATILGWTAGFYDDRTLTPKGSYAGACWRVLNLAAYLIASVDDIDEAVAIEVIDELGSIASFTSEVSDLSAGTRAQLEQIERARRDGDADDDDELLIQQA